jgi:hypothetical protein
VGAVLILIGVVGGIALIALGAKSLSDTVNGYQRVDARRGGVVTFDKAGRYSAYYEENGIRRRSDIPQIQIVLSGPGGRQTLTAQADGSTSTEHYSFGDHEGVRVTRFTISTPGRYQVNVVGAGEPSAGQPVEIAFGRGSITKGILSVAGGILGGGLIVFIGLILLIATAVRRGRYRKRMAQGGYGGYGGGYPGGPGGWPPAGPGAPPAWPAPAGAQGGPPGWAPPTSPPEPSAWPPPTEPSPAPPPSAPPPSAPPPSAPPPPPGSEGAGWGSPNQ